MLKGFAATLPDVSDFVAEETVLGMNRAWLPHNFSGCKIPSQSSFPHPPTK